MSKCPKPTTRAGRLPCGVAAAAAALALLAQPAQALDLTVEVDGARSTQGTVAIALYAGAEGWLKQAAKRERVAAGERVVFVFRDLIAGSYALAAYHDQNGNGKLDANVVGIPTEPFGFSRDARGAFGAPKFDAAAIDLKADLTTRMVLQ